MMKINHETDAQVKAQIIAEIEQLKEEAISLGFDYPLEANYETASLQDLQEFLEELRVYVESEGDVYMFHVSSEDMLDDEDLDEVTNRRSIH